MSADNWAVCPRCLDKAEKAHDAAVQRVAAMYGQVPVEEFDAARDALRPVDRDALQTFREDYGFYGAESGEVTASYSGACSECGLNLEFRGTRKFWPEKS